MRHVAGPVRNLALSFSLSLALAACGGSSGKVTPDGAAGAGGGGAAGMDGGAPDVDGAGTAGTGGGGADGGAAGASSGAAGHGDSAAPDAASDAKEAGGGDAADAAAEAGGDATDTTDTGAVTATDGGAADTVATSALCAAFAISTPAATITLVNSGKMIDTDAFSGGTLASGTYWLTSVSHFGATTYTGVTQEVLIVDASAKTVEDEFVSGGISTYRGFSYATPSVAVLAGTPVCGGTTALSAFYTVTGVGPGATLSLNATASSDVKIFTKQ